MTTSRMPQLVVVASGAVMAHSDTATDVMIHTSISSSSPVEDGAILRTAFDSQLAIHPFHTWKGADPCASDWDSVYCAHSDMFGDEEKAEEKRVTVIQLVDHGLTGPADLGALRDMPLEEVVLSGNTLSGIVDMENLPPNLKSLDLWGNKFSGLAVLTALPFNLNFLDITTNEFSGTVDLTRLPITMMFLHLTANKFTGNIDLTKLPPSLTDIHLQYNSFSGTVDLTKLPRSMIRVDLDSNDFSGRLDLTKLPTALRFLTFSSNNFNGALDLTKLPRDLIDIHAGSNTFSGSVDLTTLPQKLKRFDISDNRLTGTLHLVTVTLPSGLTYLKAKNNNFRAFDFVSPHLKMRLPKTIETLELKPARGWDSACFTAPVPVSALNMETDVLAAASQRICTGADAVDDYVKVDEVEDHHVSATKLRGAILADDVLSAANVWGVDQSNQSEPPAASKTSLYMLLAGVPAWIGLGCAVLAALAAVRERIVAKKTKGAGLCLDDSAMLEMSQSCSSGDVEGGLSESLGFYVNMYDGNFGEQGLERKHK